MFIISAIVIIMIIITAVIMTNDSPNSEATQNISINIESETHHLGDNPGNEGTMFTKNFNVSNLSSYNSAIFTITFTKWGPNTKKPPLLTINSNKIGSVIENLPEPGTDDCWDGPVSDNSYDYNCDFTYETDVYKLLKQGDNIFEIKSRKKADDYIFKNVQINMISK